MLFAFFFQITRGPPIILILWKENKNLQKWRIRKNHESFTKGGCTKNKDHLRKNPLKEQIVFH